VASADPYIGKYYSHAWVRKNLLQQTEDDIELIDKEIKEEKDIEQYRVPVEGEAGFDDIDTTVDDTGAKLNNLNAPEAEPEAIPAKPKMDDEK